MVVRFIIDIIKVLNFSRFWEMIFYSMKRNYYFLYFII